MNNIKLTIDIVRPKDKKTQYKGYELPNNMLSNISTNTVTIFPLEMSYLISNKLNFKPMPIFQGCSAYTPYLDELNANFFDNENSPEYIIFEWSAIDGRLPLTDILKKIKKIYNNYNIFCIYDHKMYYILLKKRDIKLNNTIKSDYTQKIDIYKDVIYFDNITNDNTYMILKSDIDLNILGKLSKIVYQIPAVYANIETYEGKKYSFRILLPLLRNGIIINKLPSLPYEVEQLFNNNLKDSVKSLSFSGEGLHFYKKEKDINIDVIEIK